MKTTKTLFYFGKISKAVVFALAIICMAFFSQILKAGNFDPINNNTVKTSPNPATEIIVTLIPHVYPNGFNVSCFGFSDGSIEVSASGGTGPYTYHWNTGDTTKFILGLAVTSYSVDV